MLDDREPRACPASCLCPKTPSKIRQLRRIEIRTRSGKNRRSRHCENRRRFNTYLLPGHHLYLESISLPTQPKHATMSESGYSEIVEPGGPSEPPSPRRADRYTITLKTFLCNASCKIYCRRTKTKASGTEQSPLSQGKRPPNALHGAIPIRGTRQPQPPHSLAGHHKRITRPTPARHYGTNDTILKQ